MERHADRLDELTAEKYYDLDDDVRAINGHWSEAQRWQWASERALERLMDQAQEIWEAEGNAPLREYAERQRQRAEEAERHLAEEANRNLALQVRLEGWDAPPLCPGGMVGYTVECPRCRRTLRWEGWQSGR